MMAGGVRRSGLYCRTCEYSLWGLSTRTCPECGTAFRPSEFQFVPNTVQFCCPHCRQPYFGTSEKGHLVPPEFDCVSCAQHIHMDEMVLLPAEGVQEEQTWARQMPWLERKERGAVRAWLATIGMAMIRPARVISLTPVQSSATAALWFAWVSQFVFCLSLLIVAPVFLVVMLFTNSGGGWLAPASAGIGVLFVSIVVSCFVGVIVWALVTHLVLRVTGGAQAGFGRTLQAMCYSSGANVFLAVPCFGLHLSTIGFIWWSVSAILMIRTGQGVSGLRATLAVLSLPVAGVLLGVGIALLGQSASTSFVTTTATVPPVVIPATPQHESETAKLAQALRRYRDQHGGAGPRHAVDLVAAGLAQPSDFVSISTPGDATEIRIGRIGLDEVPGLSKQQQEKVITTLADQLPKDVVAHRLGDFILTSHGIQGNKVDAKLWVVVLAPRPSPAGADEDGLAGGAVVMYGMDGAGLPLDGIVAGLADGTTLVVNANRLPRELERQNRLRAQNGLAPLPDPRQVTTTQPASGQPTAERVEDDPPAGAETE